MVKVKGIEVMSLAKILAVVYAVFGFIGGVIFTFLAMLGLTQEAVSPLLGFLSIIVLPIVYSLMGFIGGILTAVVFNWATQFTGPLQLKTDD